MAKTRYYVVVYAPFQLVKEAGIFNYRDQAVSWAKQANRIDPNYRGRGLRAEESDERGYPLKWRNKVGNPSIMKPSPSKRVGRMGRGVNPEFTKLNSFLGVMGDVVYSYYEDSEKIQGVPLKKQGAWGDTIVKYSDMLEWDRAYKSNVGNVSVVTVPWAGGKHEFVVYGNDVLKTLIEKPKKVVKVKSPKGLDSYKGYYYKRLSTGWGAKYFAAKHPEDVEDGKEDFTSKTKTELFRKIDEYGDIQSNPGSLEDAKSMSSKFHGRPSTSIAEAYETETYDSNLSGLGNLVELEILVNEGKSVIPISWENSDNPPLLTCDSEGLNLEFIGGDQELDLDEFDIDESNGKRLVEIGEVLTISYWADKHHLEGAKSQKNGTCYIHTFGEEGGEMPILVYDKVDRGMKLVGGSYKVEEEGIKD